MADVFFFFWALPDLPFRPAVAALAFHLALPIFDFFFFLPFDGPEGPWAPADEDVHFRAFDFFFRFFFEGDAEVRR
ncbi:MAG: hypothetical protein MK095_10555, partial [Phycisphaerales bacterium]|nr:hypothetical protein [Phycisphaerales bacterium]